ncbi:MerR family transcriptional regulator [Streptomyces sp. NPDC018964]|uniref:MerR family transcriptional regulator n=1 Tax=Streptomyces sp. NPDC018964 TaxID=3365058 RepID=UPI0037AB618C
MRSSKHETSVGDERESMGIGALAERFGVAAHVLRHWEAVGLLAPARDTAGRRRYGTADLTRVAVILRAKEAGLSLDAIRSLVATADRAGRRDVLREEAEALRSRIAAAQASLEMIECALGCDHQDLSRCPRFQRVVADRVGTDTTVRLPVRPVRSTAWPGHGGRPRRRDEERLPPRQPVGPALETGGEG